MDNSGQSEIQAPPRRPGRISRAVAALAMAFTACTQGDASDETKPENQLNYNPIIWEYSEYYGAQLNKLRWDEAENVSVGGHQLKIYREQGSGSAKDTQARVVNYARNSLLLTSAELSVIGAEGTPTGSPAVRAPKELGHIFFIFDSRDSMAQADPQGFFGPINGTKANLQGQSVENLTMTGPLAPEASLIYHSRLNDRINQLQQAVCVNMLEVELTTGKPGAADAPQAPESQKEVYARAQEALYTKADLCGNLALATTIKAGAQHVEDLGGAYNYYAMITDALRDEAMYYGREQPYVKLSPEQFEQIEI